MRIVPVITAILVAAFLILIVIQRDALLAFASGGSTPEDVVETTEEPVAEETVMEPADDAVRVIALRSEARVIDSAVILRGQTEAARQVDVRAETTGKVISEPLRKGAFVEAGQELCRLDPGTREVSLAEAVARLAEAQSRLPEANARLAEAMASVPAAEARILEAKANVPAASARLLEAEASVPTSVARLAEAEASVPTAEARLAEALASVPTAEARLLEAQASVPAAEARLAEARAGLPAADARVAEARARVEEAEINLNAAQELSKDGFASATRVASAVAAAESAKAGLQTALSQAEGAKAAVQNALSQVEGARASVAAANGQVESAKAAVQSAKGQVESARAGVQSAKGQVESAKAGIETAKSQIESAGAGVFSAESGLEGSSAGVQSARSGVEAARAGIQAAEAAVAAAEKEIERLIITAPFAGLLESDTAELGALLQAGGLCATVIQLDPIKVVGFVPETEVGRVELGAFAGARLSSGQDVRGQVTFLSRSADPTTRTFRTEIAVPNPDLDIRDGQTAEILISADGAPAHLLPQSSLTLNDAGALGVRLVDADMKATFVTVDLIRDTVDGVWVVGLPDQADVIVVGQEYVTEGVDVNPSFEELQP